jgi:chromosome segregation protein
MRIKRIDLCGFKSFCDKTSVDLSKNITSIVGPNGCGKSNVVDALMWAMGEQRARHLRGKSMEDVIFNGSDSRGPAGMSEVSITFENDGRVPVEYLDYSEITVTRRLHRDGSSEYQINKLPVRLRDVTNLFLGTGVGTRAYSIIEQGRVGLIVSAKPEERRHMIEEAAGITKYRRRKQSAERKMEATRQNLLRVSDVIEEIEKRLGSLRRQAQKAERYKRYKTEMREIELRAAVQRLLGLMAERKVTDNVIAEVNQKRSEQELLVEERELLLETARVEASAEERELAQLQEQLYQLENRIKLGEKQIEYQQREAEELERQSESSQSEIEQLSEQLAEATAQREEIAAQREGTKQRQVELDGRLEAKEQVSVALKAELREIAQAVSEERNQLARAEREAASSGASLSGIERRRADLEERYDRQAQEGQEVRSRLEALGSAETEVGGELEQLREQLELLRQRKEDAAARLAELRELTERGDAELEQTRVEIQQRQSRLQSLEEIQSRYEGFGDGTRAVMQRHGDAAGENGIIAVLADALESSSQYEVALESVLGQRLGTVIVDNDGISIDSIDYLKENDKGRGNFISQRGRHGLLDQAPLGVIWEVGKPLTVAPQGDASLLEGEPGVHGPILELVDVQPEHRQVAESILGDVIVVEDLEHALALWDYAKKETLVTLNGEILYANGVITGGSRDTESSGILKQKREIKQLKETISEMQLGYEQLLDRQVQLKTEVAALEDMLQQITSDGHESDKQILTREKDLGRIRADSKGLTAREQQMKSELERIEKQLATLDDERAALCERLETAQKAQHLAFDILWLLGKEQQRIGTMADAAHLELTEHRVELAEVNTQLNAIQRALSQVEQLISERDQRKTRLVESSEKGRLRVLELREKEASQRQELSELVSKSASAKEQLETRRTAYEQRLEALGEQEHLLKVQRQDLSAMAETLNAAELERSKQEMAQTHLEEQIWERYREKIQSVIFDYHLDPQVDDTQLQRLEQLKQLISRMGEINLTAIEEFNELDERYQFLTTQKGDLEGALTQLQRAIQKINRTSRKRFVETFEAVNEQFQQVFPRLFRGGRAKLLLTEADDVLESGVEIIAQPPGKKLASMDIMSGGEKALTATSLIFAMFLVKPTPFCLLDEVDAPLDEANVVRFREMVREMSGTSQFIIITHNRNTMEISDRLFGVTMEEPGVSKVVSVNLSEAEAVAA